MRLQLSCYLGYSSKMTLAQQISYQKGDYLIVIMQKCWLGNKYQHDLTRSRSH